MTPRDRDFLVEARRHLVGLVGLIERYCEIEPVCRRCGGCSVCEAMHRKQLDPMYSSRESSRSADRVSAN